MATELHDSMREQVWTCGLGAPVIWLSISVRVHLSPLVDKAGSQSTQGQSMDFSVKER